jgi:hypothetical protein
MLMGFLVPQLNVSTVIIQQDKASQGYGTVSQRNIFISAEWPWQIHSMAFQVFVFRALSVTKLV